jgi:hypothetical protein
MNVSLSDKRDLVSVRWYNPRTKRSIYQLTALIIYIHITYLIYIELRALDLCLLICLKETPRNNRIHERNAANSSGQNAPVAEYAQKRLKRDYVPNGRGQTDEARSYCAGSSVITYWIGVIIQRIAAVRTHTIIQAFCGESARVRLQHSRTTCITL